MTHEFVPWPFKGNEKHHQANPNYKNTKPAPSDTNQARQRKSKGKSSQT